MRESHAKSNAAMIGPVPGDLVEGCETRNALRGIMIRNFDWLRDADEMRDPSRLHEDLGLDSVSLVTLQVEVEDLFGIRFDPMETDLVSVFSTFGSLASYLTGQGRSRR